MDANRIKALATSLRTMHALFLQTAGNDFLDLTESADALDCLARIKSAALAETIAEIAKRQADRLEGDPDWVDFETLLDALRAMEADQEEARLRYNEPVSELIQKVNDVTGERDEARNTRQPARDRFENQVIPEEMIQRAILKPGQAASQGSHVAIDNNGSVVTAEQYNAALTANRDIKPDQGRYLLPPGRWLVGETTVKLDAAEYVCKGSWALGTACGTCRKCLETKTKQTDKERG